MTLIQISTTVWIGSTDLEAFNEKVTQWYSFGSDDFYKFFVALIISNVLNFAMNLFAVYFLEKMSRAEWSLKHRDAKETRQTTQMDREVAAKWYDAMMPDLNF